ncbi:MAG: hypothetical protein AAFY76_16995, partial [Cyanobacteria bacterium J06649_11]
MANIAFLRANWLNLLDKLNADLSIGRAIWTDLVAAHSVSTRHYHNLEHVRDLLNLTLAQPVVSSLTTLELVAWFHVYIYEPQQQDNEINSAIAATTALTRLKVSPSTIKTVKQIILSTQKHEPLIEGIDNLIFLDLDLAILGTSTARYQKYAAAIRKEYSWLSNHDYQQGRKRVLSNFLNRNNIYYTDYFYQNREAQARVNLAREIE